MNYKKLFSTLVVSLLVFAAHTQTLAPFAAPHDGMQRLSGHLVKAAQTLTPLGQLPSQSEMQLAISLPLQNTEKLTALRAALYDPASPTYRHFLTSTEFTQQFGPTEADYDSVIAFTETNGLRVVGKHPNRLVLDVAGSVANVEKTFHLKLVTYQHPAEARQFFAPDTEPSLDLKTPVLQISGLDDYSHPQPHLRQKAAGVGNSQVQPLLGSGPGGSFIGKDFRNAYLPGVTNLTGVGQSVGLLEFDGYYTNDIARYCATGAITTSVTLSNVLISGGPTSIGSGNNEVALDIQMVLSVAPAISKIYIYEAPNPSPFVTMLSRMANDNLSSQLSCSWYRPNSTTPDTASEQIFIQMILQGQSFFTASGDSDALTGSIPFPDESTNLTTVGGTTLTSNGDGSYAAETVWNWGISIGSSEDGVGSSGGVSLNFALPPWQQGMSSNLLSAGGSVSQRNVPDVALTADGIYIIYNNGTNKDTGGGGTSAAAPLWAAFMALVNQQSAALGDARIGFLNPAVYAIGNSSNYNNCFHDVTTGSNTWSKSIAKFVAVPGYDLCTGWGTPTGSNLINALVVNTAPVITAQPQSLTMGLGGFANFNVAAYGTKPVTYQWFFTDAIGAATNLSLSVSNVDFTNGGNYYLVLSNALGVTTSTVVTLTVTPAPVIVQSPTNQNGFFGQSASLSVTAFGAQPLAYQWRKNSNNIAGATGPNYLITSVIGADAANYDVIITNFFGSITSSVATFTTLFAPVYTGTLAGWDVHPLANGQNNFGVSPLAPTTSAPFLVVTGFTRGSGVGTTGAGAARAWGGNNFTNATEAIAIASNQFVTFSFTVTNGYKASFTGVSRFDYRRSGVGPPTGALQYKIGNSAFTDVVSLLYNSSAGSGDSLGSFDLTGITALQNVPAGTNVIFRVVNWGGTSTVGAWYFFDVLNSTALDFTIEGSITPTVAPPTPTNTPFLTAYDAGAGAVSGQDLVITNRSGANLSVWSSADSSLAVTTWNLVGLMNEQQFGNGNSIYRFNAIPTASPVYYIFANTNIGPYFPTEPVTWLTTTNNLNYSVMSSNVAISAAGVFNFPTPPSIVAPPQDTNIFVGKNASLSVTATGSGTLSYQWLKNGGVISGAQLSQLSFTPAATSNTGNYSVIVTNFIGSVTSSSALLNIVALPSLIFSNGANGFILAADGGAANNTYIIQGATNLTPPITWLGLQTNTIGTNGQIRFAETNRDYPAIFYRVQLP